MGVLNTGKIQFSNEKCVAFPFSPVILSINNAVTLWERPAVLFYGMHTESVLPLRKQVDWRGMKKKKEKRKHGEGASWVTAQRGRRSLPWGYVSLTPPQNEIDPLSEITSCQCLRVGKNLGIWNVESETQERKRYKQTKETEVRIEATNISRWKEAYKMTQAEYHCHIFTSPGNHLHYNNSRST